LSRIKSQSRRGAIARACLLAAVAFSLGATAALAQQFPGKAPIPAPPPLPELPDIDIYQNMLDDSQKAGWVQFRDLDGHQIVYFTMLQVLRCQLADVRYSLNSKALNQHFPLAPCDQRNPFNVPDDPDKTYLSLSLKLGEAKTLAVQAIWKDGSQSEVATYFPCRKPGASACARLKSVEDADDITPDAKTPSSQSR
jgi:hypothetical protein